MSKEFTGPAGDPAEGSRTTWEKNLQREAEKQLAAKKPTPKTPTAAEGETGGGTHPPVKSETGA